MLSESVVLNYGMSSLICQEEFIIVINIIINRSIDMSLK